MRVSEKDHISESYIYISGLLLERLRVESKRDDTIDMANKILTGGELDISLWHGLKSIISTRYANLLNPL